MYTAEQIKTAFTTLNELEQISGRNDKLAKLEANKDNPVLRQLFYWAYSGDKFHVHLDKVPLPAYGTVVPADLQDSHLEANFVKFTELLAKLKNREVTGNAAVEAVALLFPEFVGDEYTWYSRVMNHDLRVGSTKGTATRVFGKELWGSSATETNSYGFPGVMLAEKWDKHKSKYMFKEFYVEPKYDGYRLSAVIDNGQVTFYSRQGKSEPYTTNLKHVAAQLIDAGFDNCMVDGEIMKDSWNGTSVVKKKTLKPKDLEDLIKVTFIAFDFIDLKLHTQGDDIYRIPFFMRREQLEDYLKGETYPNLRLTPCHKVKNEEEAMDYHAQFRKQGDEGTMCKDADAFYYFGDRSIAWVKIKPTHPIDAKIIEFEPGEAGKKYQHTLGAMMMEDAKGVRYRCGQGFTDEDRAYIWDRRENLYGAIVEMEAQDETNMKAGPVASARNAVFLRLREDREGVL